MTKQAYAYQLEAGDTYFDGIRWSTVVSVQGVSPFTTTLFRSSPTMSRDCDVTYVNTRLFEVAL